MLHSETNYLYALIYTSVDNYNVVKCLVNNGVYMQLVHSEFYLIIGGVMSIIAILFGYFNARISNLDNKGRAKHSELEKDAKTMKDNYINRFEDLKKCSAKDKEEIIEKVTEMQAKNIMMFGELKTNQAKIFGELSTQIASINK